MIKGRPLNRPQWSLEQDGTSPFPRTCPAHRAGDLRKKERCFYIPTGQPPYQIWMSYTPDFSHEMGKERVTSAASISLSITYCILARDNTTQQRLLSCIHWSDTDAFFLPQLQRNRIKICSFSSFSHQLN